jgi:hypothetical protein
MGIQGFKIAISLVLILVPCIGGFSQSHKQLSIRLGYSDLMTRDYSVSPLLSQGGAFTAAMSYRIEKAMSFQSIELNFGKNKIKSSASNPSDFFFCGLEYSYYRTLKLPHHVPFQLGMGPFLNVRGIDRNFEVVIPPFGSFRTMETGAALASSGISAQAKYILSKDHLIQSNVALCLIGYSLRNDYSTEKIDNDFRSIIKSGRIQTINQLSQGRLSIEYQTRISKGSWFEISGELNWLDIKGKRDFSLASSLFLAGFRFNL